MRTQTTPSAWQHTFATLFGRLFPFLLTLLLLGFVPAVRAQQSPPPTLVLRADRSEYLLGQYLSYLEDPQSTLTIEQIISPTWSARFTTSTQPILNFGLSNSAYWLRLRVRNDSPTAVRWDLELARPSMRRVVLYRPLPGGGYLAHETGYIYPFATREVPDESFVFELSLPPGAEQVLYLRVEDKVMELPLRIWEYETLEKRNQTRNLLIGLSFGALLIMLVYNCFITIILRERSYIYYLIFQLALLLCLGSVQAYAPRYFWPQVTWPNHFIIPLSIELGLVGALLFAGSFLEISRRGGGWRILFWIQMLALALCIPPTFFIGVRILDVIFPLGLVILTFIPVLALHAWLRGFTPARFYLISWTIFFVIGLGVILERMGFFTVQQIIPEQALQLGVIYVVVFQSLALADRFNLYKEQTIRAQNDLVVQQQEALRLKDTLTLTLENARDQLENTVLERTRDLRNLNQELEREVETRKLAQKEAEYLARTDPLTGLANRRYFSQLVSAEIKKALRYQHPLSVMLLDIDHFKNVNDTFGHQIGDMAIVHVTQILQHQSRGADILARYGGEEFIALLPETSLDEARQAAERLRAAIQDANLKINGRQVSLTVSIGVAGLNVMSGLEEFDDLLKQADEALYRAKDNGRNRVTVFTQS